MNQNILTEGKLLDENGNLCQAGYATKLIKQYNRAEIKAGKLRIKEWDYYYIGNNHYGIAVTVADNSYMSLVSVSFLNFDDKTEKTTSAMGWFTNGKTNLPSTSEKGNISYKDKKGNTFDFIVEEDGKRLIKVNFVNFNKAKETFTCDVVLTPTNSDTMVIATPFNKKKHFYYNQKMNLLNAEGKFTIGSKEYTFSKEDTYGVLDWGRGVWTYKNTWYWGSLNTIQDGKRVGLNLGYGFGCNNDASENMLFIEDKSIKIDEVQFLYSKDYRGREMFDKTVEISSNDGILNLTFTPIFNRHADTNALLIRSNQNQVFGHYNGTIKYGEGKTIELKDQVGFIEKVYNRW